MDPLKIWGFDDEEWNYLVQERLKTCHLDIEHKGETIEIINNEHVRAVRHAVRFWTDVFKSGQPKEK